MALQESSMYCIWALDGVKDFKVLKLRSFHKHQTRNFRTVLKTLQTSCEQVVNFKFYVRILKALAQCVEVHSELSLPVNVVFE